MAGLIEDMARFATTSSVPTNAFTALQEMSFGVRTVKSRTQTSQAPAQDQNGGLARLRGKGAIVHEGLHLAVHHGVGQKRAYFNIGARRDLAP